jgi:hypothetical protein
VIDNTFTCIAKVEEKMFPMLCPFFLQVKVGKRQGRALGNEDDMAMEMGCSSMHTAKTMRIWAKF